MTDGFYRGNSCLDIQELNAPYALVVEDNHKLVCTTLKPYIGKEIKVAWLADHNTGRNSFETQISVQGKLDAKFENGKGHFQVLQDNQTYSYFYCSNVWQITKKSADELPTVMIGKTSKTDLNYQAIMDPIGDALDLEKQGLI